MLGPDDLDLLRREGCLVDLGTAAEAIITEGNADAPRSDWRCWYGYDPDRSTSLALAFVAAVRATEEGTGDDKHG